MIRITSGLAKNKKLKIPNVENIRVVQDKVRQAIFSILGEEVNDAVCADFYAGSGVMGIEALSRGASYCDFVDKEYEAVKTIKENLKLTGFENELKIDEATQEQYILERESVHLIDCVKFSSRTLENYDIVFLDPFYNDTKLKFLFQNLERSLKPNGYIIFLHGDKADVDELLSNTKLTSVDERRYGATILSVVRHNKSSSSK